MAKQLLDEHGTEGYKELWVEHEFPEKKLQESLKIIVSAAKHCALPANDLRQHSPAFPESFHIMNPEMPKDLKKWEITREKGKAKFILVTGVLSWGLPMFAVMTFVINRKRDEVLPPWLILVSALIWGLGGALFGWVIWTLSEKKYQKYLATHKPQ